MTRDTLFYSNNAYIIQKELGYVQGGRTWHISEAWSWEIMLQGEKMHKHCGLDMSQELIGHFSFNQSSL